MVGQAAPQGVAWDASVALITGAAGDIGRAVAVRLAELGVTSVLADLDGASQELHLTRDLCRAVGAATEVVTFDVTDHAQVGSQIALAAARVGAPNLVFNNAGYQGEFVTSLAYDPNDFAKVLDINVGGVFSVLQCAANAMVAAGTPGSIVNTASMAGVGGAPNMVAYSASKAAVIGLTKSAAKDLAPHSIRVNAVSPAFIGPGIMWDRQVQLQAEATSQYFSDLPAEVEKEMINQVPLRRYGSLDEVASAVIFLLSGESSYITGFNMEVSGGAQ